MGYTMPSLQELKKLAAILKDEYKGASQQRLDFLTLAQHLALNHELDSQPEQSQEILMGAYLFEMQMIGREYRWYSPDRSSLYHLIQDKLKLAHDETLTDTQKFICITAFYNYAKNADDNLAADTDWYTNEALAKDVLKGIETLLTRQYPQVHSVLTALPRSENITKNMQGMTMRYNALSPPTLWGFRGGAYVSDARFVDFISAYCEKFGEEALNADPYCLRLGSLVYAMKQVELTYSLPSYASRSQLHQLCEKAANIKLSTDIPQAERGTWLLLLSNELSTICKDHQDFIDEFAEKTGMKDIRQWLGKHQSNLYQQLSECQLEVIHPNSMQASATSAVGGAAAYGMKTAIRTTTGFAFPTTTSLLIRGAAAGATGFAIFGPGGALLGVSLSLVKNIGSVIVANLLMRLLSRMGKTVAGGAAEIIAMPIDASRRGIIKLYEKYKGYEAFTPEEIRENDAFINALMSLPDDVFSLENKQNLERTLVPVASNSY